MSLSFAQSPKAIVEEFFVGLNNRDTTVIKKTLYNQVNLESVFVNKEGDLKVLREDMRKFLKTIGTTDDHTWREEVSNWKVNETALLTNVSCDYQFYYDGQLSHQGTNFFQLVQQKNTWKIIYIIDSRIPPQ